MSPGCCAVGYVILQVNTTLGWEAIWHELASKMILWYWKAINQFDLKNKLNTSSTTKLTVLLWEGCQIIWAKSLRVPFITAYLQLLFYSLERIKKYKHDNIFQICVFPLEQHLLDVVSGWTCKKKTVFLRWWV